MNLKGIFQSLIGLTISLVLFNNCSTDFAGSDTGSGDSSSVCSIKTNSLQNYDPALELAAATAIVKANPFQSSKIASELLPSNGSALTKVTDEDVVVLVSNKCLKTRAATEMSAATKSVRVAEGSEDKKMWSYKLKKSDLALDSSASVEAIEADPCVIGVGPNRTYTLSSYAASDFTDTLYSQQSTLPKIHFFDSLAYFYRSLYGIGTAAGTPKATVAVIDTGVHYEHPDLAANILKGTNGYGVDATTLGSTAVSYNASDIDTASSHGTHVSGLIAAVGANGLGITGVAPKGVNILPIRGFYLSGSTVTSDTDTIAKAVLYAADQNVDVINLSLGGTGDDPIFKAALLSAVSDGVFIAVAAGNDGQTLSSTFKRYPASYASAVQGMVAVASIDAVPGTLSTFSNRSNTEIEIAAPGNSSGTTGIASTIGASSYGYLRGTSQASPHVAAAAALIVALVRETGGTKPSPAAIESLLLESAAKTSGLTSTVLNGNLLDLSSLGALVNKRYPKTIGGTGGACN